MTMDFHLALGIIAFAFGCFTVYATFTGNEKLFAKKEAMKKAYGEKWGAAVHFFSYALVPLTVGIIFILKSVLK